MIETKIVNSDENISENDLVYDIDKGVELLKEFISKTALHTKDFYKIAKKMKGKKDEQEFVKKEQIKFCKEKLLNSWNYFFSSKFYKYQELELLEKEVLYTYILGVFISGHSSLPNVKNNINKILANTIYEMTQRSFNIRENQ